MNGPHLPVDDADAFVGKTVYWTNIDDGLCEGTAITTRRMGVATYEGYVYLMVSIGGVMKPLFVPFTLDRDEAIANLVTQCSGADQRAEIAIAELQAGIRARDKLLERYE